MRWISGAALALLLAASLVAVSSRSAAAETAPPTAADRAAVEALAYRFVDAWNKHDMPAFASLFHNDAEWINWRGGLWRGREAIYEGHKGIHETFYRNSTMHFVRLENVRFLSDDAAVIRVREDLTGDERSPAERHRYRKTMIATRDGGDWLLAYGHNTRVQEGLD
jgi:uncharacterized protein (TIGR02246 family)